MPRVYHHKISWNKSVFMGYTTEQFRQHIQALGVRTRDDWVTSCNDSYKCATKRGQREYRKIVEGLLDTAFLGKTQRSSASASKYDNSFTSLLDFCYQRGIKTSKDLLAAHPKEWDELGAQDKPEFWQGVRIMCFEEKLPKDFDPTYSAIPLGVEHLERIGYKNLPPQ